MVHQAKRGTHILVLAQAALIVVGVLSGISEAGEGSYPSKTVEIVVPYAAGGAGDVLTRKVASYLQKQWGQPINVINRPGAGGATGTVSVLQSRPDGYVVCQGGTTNLYLNEAVQKDAPYQWSDLAYVSMLGATPVVIVVKAESKWMSLKDLAEDIRRDPAKFKFGTSGVAGPSTFITALLAESVSVDPNKLRRVPFDGGAPALAAVAGGHVDFAGQNLPEVLALVKGGRLRALAIGTTQRSRLLPDVPTTKEAGFEAVKWAGLYGFIGPTKLGAEVVRKWENTLAGGMAILEPELESAGLLVEYLKSKDFRSRTEQEFKTSLAIAEKLQLRK